MGSGTVPYAPVTGKGIGVARLVIVAPNWLGDAVMALPAIADIRRAAPGATLAIAARRPVAPLFTMAPGVDEIVTLEGRRAARHDADLLRAGRFEAALLLPNSWRTAMIVRRAAIPERWGYRTAFRGPLLTRAPRPPADVHQAVYYQHLVRALGVPTGALDARLHVTDEGTRAGHDLLVAAGWDGRRPLVALAPGAAYGGAKRWPAASFAGLASALAEDGVGSVLVGGPADREAGLEVLAGVRAGTPLLDVMGRTDLPALAGVLTCCRGLVSNDSGAMHVASALGVPVTALFGPTNELATHPIGSGAHAVLTHRVWCRPCMLRECPLDHRCLTGIDVRTALDAARRGL